MQTTRSEARPHPYGIAVVGSGAWGSNHVRLWQAMGHLRSVVDPSGSRRAAIAEEYPDVGAYADLDAVLDDPAVDAVVVASPAVTHAEIALRCLDAGKHVLVEKPLALTTDDAEKVAAAAEAAQRVLLVGHVLEYHPAVQRLRELIGQGVLGKVRYVYSNRLNFGRFRTEEDALWSFAPHDIALILRLLGRMPDDVTCTGGAFLSERVADTTLMSLRFSGGVHAHVFVSWLHPFKEHRFVVVGDRSMAVFDDTAPWEEKLLLYPHTVDWLDGTVPFARRADAEAVPLEPLEPLRAECEAFLAAIEHGEAPLTDGASATRVLRVLDAGGRSLASGGTPVSVGEARSDPPSIHPTAVVEPGATVGARTKVWHHAHVMRGARVGEGCVLGKNVFVAGGAQIGNGVRIQNNVSVYDGVVLEDGVFCGPSAVFTNVRTPRSGIDRKAAFESTIVRAGATIGANATIVCGTEVGRYALVGAGAVVTQDVVPQALMAGVPARRIGWVCTCGDRLPDEPGNVACRGCDLTWAIEHDRITPGDHALPRAGDRTDAASAGTSTA